MSKMSLDDLDKKILREVQKGEAASANVSHLAKKLEKPTTTIHSRIKKLEKCGMIKGYKATIDSKKLGAGITGFILLQLNPGSEPDEVAERLSKIEGVKEIHFTTGDWYLLLKIRVQTLEEYYDISGEKIVKMPEFSKIVGMIAPRIYKEDTTIDVW